MKNLYRVKAKFLGKDLCHEVISGYIVAENDEEVFEELNKEAYWDERSHKEVKRIKEEKGTYDFPYEGEFYDIKYKWEKVKEVLKKEENLLLELGILRNGIAEYL